MITGYTIDSAEIVRAAQAQREAEAAAIMNGDKVAGRFTWHAATGTVSGPAEYMRERYDARVAEITAGRDIVTQMGIAQHGDTVLAVLVSLQTDYAAWAGMRGFAGGR